MAEVIPGEGREEYTRTARLLLEIAGPSRAREVESGTLPARFMVPDDIAEEYIRRTSRAEAAVPVVASAARTTGTRRGAK